MNNERPESERELAAAASVAGLSVCKISRLARRPSDRHRDALPLPMFDQGPFRAIALALGRPCDINLPTAKIDGPDVTLRDVQLRLFTSRK